MEPTQPAGAAGDRSDRGDGMTDVPEGPIRVAIVDDHEIVLRGLRALAAEHPETLEVVLTVGSTEELFAGLAEVAADVVLLDLMLGDHTEPTDTIERIVELGLPCLVHTSEIRPARLQQVMAAGASGVALKSDPEERVLEALTEVAAGEVAMSSEMAYVLATDTGLVAHLAPRELQTLRLLAQGVPKKAIGHRLDPPVKPATVTTFLSRAGHRYAELGREVGTSFDIVREAFRDGHLDF